MAAIESPKQKKFQVSHGFIVWLANYGTYIEYAP